MKYINTQETLSAVEKALIQENVRVQTLLVVLELLKKESVEEEKESK